MHLHIWRALACRLQHSDAASLCSNTEVVAACMAELGMPPGGPQMSAEDIRCEAGMRAAP